MALGRDFTAEEANNMGSGNVLVLSNDEWRAHFASDPGVIGRSVKVNGNPFTIIGVRARGIPGYARTSGDGRIRADDRRRPRDDGRREVAGVARRWRLERDRAAPRWRFRTASRPGARTPWRTGLRRIGLRTTPA
jgi:hypothetical protein